MPNFRSAETQHLTAMNEFLQSHSKGMKMQLEGQNERTLFRFAPVPKRSAVTSAIALLHHSVLVNISAPEERFKHQSIP